MYNDHSVLENHHLAVAFKLTRQGAAPGWRRSLLSTLALLWCRLGAGVDVQRSLGARKSSLGRGVQVAAACGRSRHLRAPVYQDLPHRATHRHRRREYTYVARGTSLAHKDSDIRLIYE